MQQITDYLLNRNGPDQTANTTHYMMPALGGGQAAVLHQNAILHAYKLLDRELHEYVRFTSSILSSAHA
ncbi:MAG: hypothetical protein PVG72_02970 [Gammaproteobacteria bacterium]|jgi:hypothetical protein